MSEHICLAYRTFCPETDARTNWTATCTCGWSDRHSFTQEHDAELAHAVHVIAAEMDWSTT